MNDGNEQLPNASEKEKMIEADTVLLFESPLPITLVRMDQPKNPFVEGIVKALKWRPTIEPYQGTRIKI